MKAKRILLNLFSKNLGFKILAVVLAVIIWLVIVNIEDPDKSRVMTVPVTVENEEYLLDQGMSYQITGSKEVSFTVSGPRSIVEDLTETDFKATADLSDINESMNRVPIQINVTRFNSSGLELQKRTQYLNVEVEKIIEKELDVEVDMQGAAPANRHITVESVNPEKITVTGPETILGDVTTAMVSVDVSEGDENFSRNGEIVLQDKKGGTVEQTGLELSDKQATVQFSVDARKELSLTARTSGTPAEGYMVTAIECTPATITVTGADDLLNNLSEIELSSDQVVLTDRSESFTSSVPIAESLPKGIVLADGASTKAEVTVTIEPYVTKELTLDTGQIKPIGLSDGYRLTFDEPTITITLKGREEDLSDVEAGDITGTVDVGGLKEGSQSVTLKLDGSWTLNETVSVPVTMKRE